MSLLRLGFLILAIFLTSTEAAEAQKLSKRNKMYSSLFTDLKRDCLWLNHSLNYDDSDLVCKGYGDYKIFISFENEEPFLTVYHQSNPKLDLFQKIVIPDYKKGIIEWRFANRKPFAIMVRSKKWDEAGGKKKKDYIAIRGLKGFEFIAFSLQAKSIDQAKKRGRQLLDLEYEMKKKASVEKRAKKAD